MLGRGRRKKGALTQIADSLTTEVLGGCGTPIVIDLEDGEENGEMEVIEENTEEKTNEGRVNTKRFYGAAPKMTKKNKAVLSDDEEEGVLMVRSRPQRVRKIKLLPGDYEEIVGDEIDFQTRSRKRRSSQAESGSESWSESESESDISDDGSSGKWRRGRMRNSSEKRRAAKGDRRSERAPKGAAEGKSDMTDREFEKMLNRKEREIPAYKQKRKLKVKKKKKKTGMKNVRRTGIDPEEGNRDICQVCKDGGEIILCDKCPRSFHKECAKIEEVPEGDWECPRCTGQMSESEESDSGHEHQCRVCRNGGEVLLCDDCPCVFHMGCLNPPMTFMPEGHWQCPRCEVLQKPLIGWVQSVITWKWSKREEGFDELDHTRSPIKKRTEQLKRELAAQNATQSGGESKPEKRPERLLFVKFKDYSYWECDWITELQLEVFHPTTFIHFKRKFDQEEPPALEDGSSFGEKRHHANKKIDDPLKLEERFYKWGIRPSWLQIHRILNHD